MTRRWKASRLIYRVDKLWGGYNSSRRLSERLERTATSTREGNARGRPSDIAQETLGSRSVSKAMACAWRGPQVGGEGRSKPSALRRLSHLFSVFRARSGRRARSNTYGDLLGSRLQEWLLGRRGGGTGRLLE